MPESIEEMVARIADEAPRIPGVNWAMALSVSILRTLEEDDPGFRARVLDTIRISAESMEQSGDPEQVEDAPSMRELAGSWIFTEERSAD